jgi:hypothetical protein
MVVRQFLRTNRGSTCLGKLNTVRAAVFATSAFNPTSYEMLHWTLHLLTFFHARHDIFGLRIYFHDTHYQLLDEAAKCNHSSMMESHLCC